MNRRRFLATAAALPLAATVAGCLGDEQEYEFDASPATIPPAALDDAGYEGEEPEQVDFEHEVEAGGIEAEISATTWNAMYSNPDAESVLFVASTPDATIAGQSVNPLVRANNGEVIERLLDLVQEGADVDVDDFEQQGTETRPILGTDGDVTTFSTTLDVGNGGPGGAGEDVPVFVHVATVPHDDDVVVLVGIHPQAVDERESLLSLMERVEH